MALFRNLAKIYGLLLIMVLAVILAGCATVTEQTTSPDNKKIYGIDCSGMAVPMSKCYAEAQKMCPAGYTILSNQAPTQPSIDVPIHEISDAIAYSIPGVKKGITVECR